MSEYKTDVDHAEINAALRARFGASVTRKELLQYRDETTIDPVWIRRNPDCRSSRGTYLIPGENAPAAPARKTPKSSERTVLESPFASGEYDGTPAPVEPAVEDADTPTPIFESVAERPAPIFVSAWLCLDPNCVGRKPGTFYMKDAVGDLIPPVCECGSAMHRHTWTRKTRR